jgi:hypothetical protein
MKGKKLMKIKKNNINYFLIKDIIIGYSPEVNSSSELINEIIYNLNLDNDQSVVKGNRYEWVLFISMILDKYFENRLVIDLTQLEKINSEKVGVVSHFLSNVSNEVISEENIIYVQGYQHQLERFFQILKIYDEDVIQRYIPINNQE